MTSEQYRKYKVEIFHALEDFLNDLPHHPIGLGVTENIADTSAEREANQKYIEEHAQEFYNRLDKIVNNSLQK